MDHHGPKGKGRVLVLAQLKVACGAKHHQHNHQETGQGRMFDRPARQIETLFRVQMDVAHDGLSAL